MNPLLSRKTGQPVRPSSGMSPRSRQMPAMPFLSPPNSKAPASEPIEKSRVQSRLKSQGRRDQVFLKVLRNQRSTRSWPSQRLDKKYFVRRWRHAAVLTLVGLSMGGMTWLSLFMSGRVTLGGVPYPILNKFWDDEAAKVAYFGGDRQTLHDRLSEMNIEEDIKDYYRRRFDDEGELDRYIHQIMFDRTGYVGEAYKVDNYGRLFWKGY